VTSIYTRSELNFFLLSRLNTIISLKQAQTSYRTISVSQFIPMAFQMFYPHMTHGHLNLLKHSLVIYRIVVPMLATLSLSLNRSRKSSTTLSDTISSSMLATLLYYTSIGLVQDTSHLYNIVTKSLLCLHLYASSRSSLHCHIASNCQQVLRSMT